MSFTPEQLAQQKLDKLSLDFTAWRDNKKNSRERIPVDLLIQAQQLSDELSNSVVRKRLGLSSEALRRTFSDSQSQMHTATTFSEVTYPQPDPLPSLKVEIHLPTGEHITISNLSGRSPSDIVTKLLA